jgi:hypothetical protein
VSTELPTPYITVYTGNSLGTLTRVSTNIDSVTWSGTSGNIFYIAVTTADEYRNSELGFFVMTRSIVVATPPPPPPVIAAPPVVAAPPAVAAPPPDVVASTPPQVVVSTPSTTPPTPATPPATSSVKIAKGGKNATPLSIAKKARITVPKAATVSTSVKSDSKKVCSLVGGKLQFKKKTTCNVTVKVTPKKGKATSHSVAVSP